MQIKLIEGVFTIEEAEALLTAIFKTKIEFHKTKIRTIQVEREEEDIKHSEQKILELQQTLEDAIKKMKEKGQINTTLNAYIEVNTMRRLTQ